MKTLLAAACLALASCSPDKTRSFELGIIGPAGPGLAASAREAGLTIRESVPEGAAGASAGKKRMAGWSELRLLVAVAAVEGREGLFFILPREEGGREVSAYPEEWQALARVSRETSAIRPILERGVPTPVPFSAPGGVMSRAWRYQGRVYALLVNEGEAAPMDGEPLRPWRALFEVRADPREALVPCPRGRCLPARRALWLEGRL